MRSFIFMFLALAFGLGLLTSPGGAQDPKEKDPQKVLDGLLLAVKHKDVNARIQAIVALADFGPKAAPALPDLLDALQDKNEDLRLNAAITLAKIGKEAVKPVAKLLDSKDEGVKFYAIWTIGWIGPDAKETVPAMIKLVNDKNEGVRRKAIFALGRLAGDPDKTISVLVEAFKDENDDVRQAAGEALARFGKPAVTPLIELLKSDNPKARLQASTSLGDIGSEAKEAVPLLKDLFLAKDTSTCHHYAQVLGKLGKAGMPALEAGFKDSRAEVRQAAAQSMQQAGADAVGVLIDALGDKNVEVRRLAAQTLWPMRIGDKSVVIALAFAMASDEDDTVRQWCMNGLVQLGAQAKLAGPKLKEALSDMNPNIRVQAFQLLQTIGDNPGPTLVKALASKNEKVRINTACLMLSVNVETERATPVLIDALENKDLGLKMQAASTLAQRQLQKDKVLPIFLDGLKHPAAGVRVQAVQGVGSFGQGASGSAPAIAKMLGDPDANVGQTAVNSLHQIGGGAGEAVVPILAGIMKDGKPESRRMVMQVMQIYGEKSLDLLAAGLKDKDGNVRQHAVWSVQNGNFRGIPDKILPVLTKSYKDGDAGVKVSVLQVVWVFGGKAKDIVSAGLKDKDTNVRQHAINALQNLQGDLTEALPTIVSLMKEKDSGVNRHQLVWLLGRAGEGAIPHLGDLLKDADANIRAQSAQMLRGMGEKAAKVLPALREAVKDENANVRLHAMLAVAAVGKEGQTFLVKQFGAEKDANVRSNLFANLAYSNERNLAVPLLKSAMQDDSAQVRQTAINVLGVFGRDSKEGLEAFEMGLKDSDGNVRSQANGLSNFYGEKSWPPLERALKSVKDAGNRQALLQSLQNVGYRAKTGVAPLIDCLTDKNVTVKHLACNVLANIGADAADALPTLRKLAKDDSNQAVQNAAKNAVTRIEVKKER